MANVFTQAADRFLGRGEASVAIPPMDGALKPNSAVDKADHLLSIARPDNLLRADNSVLFSSGRKLLAVGGDWSKPAPVVECEAEILATASAPDGSIAIFDEVRGLSLLDMTKRSMVRRNIARLPFASVTAATFRDADTLLVCVGSTRNSVTEWQRDLLDSEVAGSVWSVDLRTSEAKPIAEGLSYPAGCIVLADGKSALVSESWKNRLVLLDLDRKKSPTPVLTALPGYPGRLSPRAQGGCWLSLFAPRNQLVEFVRRERTYRRAMMAEVPKEFWVAPALSSGASFSEPMQGGALIQMGILKPWAPTRSYGLVVALDDHHSPVASFHSRTGGTRHGLTSTVEYGSGLVVASKGGDEIISIALSDGA
jgi:hypothetical protein